MSYKLKTIEMKKNLFVALFATIALSSAHAQGDTIPSNWKLKAIYGLNGTQSSFVNWNAGGRNNIALLGYVAASAKYEKGKIKWDNDLGAALGGMQFLDQSAGNQLQKTDDRLEIASNFGYKLKDYWFLSMLGSFRTQFIEGFDANLARTSTFMAPGYLNLSLGIDYTPNDNFSAFLSPVASKMTFVNDPALSAAGSFGVPAGETFRGEFGAHFRMKYDRELFTNVQMKSKLELFSNYIENPQNIDVNAELAFFFKVNSWLSTSLQWNLIYDDDIRITDANGNTGPRTQFKSVLSLGISYTMQNFKEE